MDPFQNLGGFQYVDERPLKVLRKWEGVLPDLFSGFGRLNVPIFLWGPIV
jgi:hypothetical protein